MGAVGFLYESIKDNIKWNNLEVKQYTSLVANIGKILTMSDKDYQKYKVEHTTMSDEAISSVFLKAFGDGK